MSQEAESQGHVSSAVLGNPVDGTQGGACARQVFFNTVHSKPIFVFIFILRLGLDKLLRLALNL